MDYLKTIEEIIRENKWIRNDIGMGKIQCTKIVKENEKLMAIIVSNKLETPISSFIRKIIVLDGEIILFYDGEYYEKVEEGEYNRYKDYFSADEWKIIMGNNKTQELVQRDKVSKREGIYVEIHETAKEYINSNYDEKQTNELNNMYKL
ncbi:hypothetical protein [Clostridium felsineum]|uniref:Uncharacterized protein n=1 Tax=Clostridium felsineum TaxID=36839 RepID=A0A1S8LAY5_9CLOT|nr:hypothetical protein [Clostridium felsineum]MCR3761897.1 hypothetical protein [Clostridium felsineum]URZ05756.1 hypothetical protein CLROS_010820 [Clostridium felsineum]URZ10795.1 hypothetical protein CROST_015050 [Clostridium felsineum]